MNLVFLCGWEAAATYNPGGLTGGAAGIGGSGIEYRGRDFSFSDVFDRSAVYPGLVSVYGWNAVVLSAPTARSASYGDGAVLGHLGGVARC